MKYAKGVSWTDDTRIPFVDDGLKQHIDKYGNGYGGNGQSMFNTDKTTKIYGDTKGRFTPSLLVCDDMLNDGSITSQSSGVRKNPGIKTDGWYNGHNDKKPIMTQGDKGSSSRYYDLDKWFDKIIDSL